MNVETRKGAYRNSFLAREKNRIRKRRSRFPYTVVDFYITG